jgi:hypothetical protein
MVYPPGARPPFVNVVPAYGHMVYPGGPGGSPGGPPPAGGTLVIFFADRPATSRVASKRCTCARVSCQLMMSGW